MIRVLMISDVFFPRVNGVSTSIATFRREGLMASLENTWAMEIEPGQVFVYELSRPNGRLFQVEFDLSRPVPAPPAPWGSELAPE